MRGLARNLPHGLAEANQKMTSTPYDEPHLLSAVLYSPHIPLIVDSHFNVNSESPDEVYVMR